MTHEALLQAIVSELQKMNAALNIITESLGNGHGPNVGPNFQRALPEYPAFDWEVIGAAVVKRDQHGATVVKWRGDEYTRRRHTDYDASIWFSRYTGHKDENDRKVYARLITFSDRPRIVKGLPDEVTDRLPDSPTEPQEQQKPSAANVPQPTNPRVQFYQLLPQLVRAGKLTTEAANQLTNLAKQEGYAAALQTAQELASQDAAPQPAKQSQSQPTAADLLYPKNELDAFFPRE